MQPRDIEMKDQDKINVKAKQPINSKPDIFLKLPKALEEKIVSYFPITANEGMQQLSGVNRRLNALFKPHVLTDRVVCGDLNTVKTILKNAALQHAKQQEAFEAKGVKEIPHALSDLLLNKKKVVDYSGRTITGTPLQLAWGAEDPEMIDVIQRTLLTLPDGKTIIQAQYDEQFKAGWQEKEEKEWSPIMQSMRDAFLAIEQAQDTDVTYENKKFTIHSEGLKRAVTHFRILLAEQMKKPIGMGRHFHSALWLEAAERCDDDNAWVRRGEWSDRNRLANCQLYGFIQRFLPARSAMATAQGIYYITQGVESVKRSFKFRHEPTVSIYPLAANSEWVLGENYYAGGGDRDCGGAGGGRRTYVAVSASRRCCKTFVKQQQQTCRSYEILGNRSPKP